MQLTCDLFAIANFLIVMLKPAVSSPLPPPRVVGGGHVVGPVSRCVCLSVCLPAGLLQNADFIEA